MNEFISPNWLREDGFRQLVDWEAEARVQEMRRIIALCEDLETLDEWQPGATIRVKLPKRFQP